VDLIKTIRIGFHVGRWTKIRKGWFF
jgi:hypothetical protein